MPHQYILKLLVHFRLPIDHKYFLCTISQLTVKPVGYKIFLLYLYTCVVAYKCVFTHYRSLYYIAFAWLRSLSSALHMQAL